MDKAPDAFRTISEVADDLDVPQHVLRFWESRFPQIKPMKRAGGRRYYRPDDVDLLRGIHHLLYGEGYTIRGVQRILKDSGVKFVQTVWQEGAASSPPDEPEHHGEKRGLLGMLPALLGREPGAELETVAERDHGFEPVTARMAQAKDPDPGNRGLPAEGLRGLQEALTELGECHRLLDAVLVREQT